MGGKAHGIHREYQVECRNVLTFRHRELSPYSGDGIDVLFDLEDTHWTFDIALRGPMGSLVIAECRRTVGFVKQEDVASFAYKIEMVRKALKVPVAGVFFAMKGHQEGAIRVGQFNGIQIAILEAGSTPPAFQLTFLRYDSKREAKLQDIIMHMAPGSLTITGHLAKLVHRKVSGESESR